MKDNGLRRQADLQHLSKIPVIENNIQNIKDTLGEIKESVKDVPIVKNDVGWLKLWHNRIVLGIVLAGALGIISLIFTAKR